jgi:hypothetical protein
MAIITDQFRRYLVQKIIEDTTASPVTARYFLGIGRSQAWNDTDTAPDPINGIGEQRNFRLNLQSLKQVGSSNITFTVPRYNWISGTIYSAYSNFIAGYPTNPYYVFTEDNNVYVCLERGKNNLGSPSPSTIKPTGTGTIKTADGYVWKFLYNVGVSASNSFLSSNFLPIKFLESDPGLGADAAQWTVQQAAVAGTISNIEVTGGGSGYTSAPTVTIQGNGTGAVATATVSGGQVVKIEVRTSGGTYTPGSGYDYANLVISGGGGSGATARVNLAPANGFGANPLNDLKCTGIMFTSDIAGTDPDFIVGQDFRQIGIIKDPVNGSGTAITSATASALTYMTLSSGSGFAKDKIIQGTTSGAKAYIDDISGSTIYYHQDDTTGFLAFQNGEPITETNGSGSGTISVASNIGDIDRFGGEILYIDNRANVDRDSDQTEALKVIIQL